jgi:uncharacterized membrane protein
MSEEYAEEQYSEESYVKDEYQNVTPDSAKKGNSSTKIIIGVLVGVLLLCCIIPLCVMAMLTLMGPSIGNVFSDVIIGLEATPLP